MEKSITMSAFSSWTFVYAAVLTVYVAIIVPSHGNGQCSVGQDVEDRSGILSNATIAVVLPDNVIQCNGVVSTWQFWAQQSFAFKAIVYRPLGGANWIVVGVNDIPASEVRANQKSTYVVPYDQQFEVQSGDVIGIGQYANSPIIDMDGAGTTSLYVAVKSNDTSALLTLGEIFSLRAGSSVTAVSSASVGGSAGMVDVSLSATVKPGCTVGDQVVDRRVGFLTQNTIAVVLADYAVSCDGVVSSWVFWPQKAGSFRAMVLRAVTGTSHGMWTIVGINDIPTSAVRVNQMSSYIVPTSDQIQVQTGDVIGFAQYETSHPLLEADITPGAGTSLQAAVTAIATKELLTKQQIQHFSAGSNITTVASESIFPGSTNVRVSISAEVLTQSSSGQGYVRFMEPANYQTSEHSGNVTLTVIADSYITPTTIEVVTINSQGTADVGIDYEDISSRMIELTSSETSKTFTVSILNDDIVESEETFKVAIVSATSGVVGDPSEVTITIVDDDKDSKTVGCSVGDPVIARTLDLSHHRLVAVLPDSIIPCDGLVTKWQFWAKQAVSFKAVVFRQTPAPGRQTLPGSYQIVGINDIPATSINLNQKSTYLVPESDEIQVRSGDILGIAQFDNNPLLAADSSNTATILYVAYDRPLQVLPQILTEQDIAALRPGNTINTVTIQELGGSGPVEVSFFAEVKPGQEVTTGRPGTGHGSRITIGLYQMMAITATSILCFYWQL